MSSLPVFASHPMIAWPVFILVLIVLLYLARSQMHRLIKSFSRVTSQALRLASKSLILAERRLKQRNREVLLASGALEVEKELEREFHRVDAVVKRDLQTYPAFHRSMSDLITRIDEDYRKSTEVPPSPPAWPPSKRLPRYRTPTAALPRSSVKSTRPSTSITSCRWTNTAKPARSVMRC